MNTLRLALSLVAALAAPAAAVPPGFNVQGRLTDSSGVNRNGTFSIKFTLYDAPTAGNALWARTIPSISVNAGNFQVTLQDPPDFGSTNANLFSALSGDNRFLEIQVLSGPPGTLTPEPPMVPRQQLVSNPFAVRSGVADTVSSGTVVTINTTGVERMRVDASGNVGIGTTSPSAALEVAGTMRMSGATPSFNIKNVAPPIDLDDAATKRFVLSQTPTTYVPVKSNNIQTGGYCFSCIFPQPSCPTGMHMVSPTVSWNVAEQGGGYSYYSYYPICNCETWTLCTYP